MKTLALNALSLAAAATALRAEVAAPGEGFVAVPGGPVWYRVSGTLWQTDRFVEELHAVRLQLGLERLHLLGHSWGRFEVVEGAGATFSKAPEHHRALLEEFLDAAEAVATSGSQGPG